MADTTDSATCPTCGGYGFIASGPVAVLCKTCGGPKPITYVSREESAILHEALLASSEPVPDPRVTALVTAAKGIDAFAEHRITCSMRRIQTQHIPCSCGLSPARKDLTAALEAFPND